MSITPQMVKELREKTGAGMMDCKKVLAEANGDIEKAIELLRKKGVATAAKKAGRKAADGLIGHFMDESGRLGVLVEVNCETDFVTKTEDFTAFVNKITNVVKEKNPSDMDALFSTALGGKSVKDVQTEVVAKIGENISARRFSRLDVNGSKKISQYIHAGSKIGVMVVFNDPSGKLDQSAGREVAMHVAAMHPQYVRNDEVPPKVIEKEREIIKAQMTDTKKPPEILDKIVSGKLSKFYNEVCLENQLYVKDPEGKSTVAGWLKKIDGGISIESFVRFQVGEGME